jgi:Skp family chaperone for outer membrane proteins
MNQTPAARRLAPSLLAILALVGVGSLAFHSGARLAASAPAEPPIVATVSIERLINDCAETKTRNEANETKYRPNFEELKKMDATLTGLLNEAKLLTKEDTAAKRQLKLRGQELEGAQKAKTEFLRSALDEEKASVLGDVYTRALQTIKQYATQNNIDLVLADDTMLEVPPEGGSAAVVDVIYRRRLLYANHSKLDITQDVLTQMNNDFAAAGGKPAPKAAPK